jgi:hypothetical protein
MLAYFVLIKIGCKENSFIEVSSDVGLELCSRSQPFLLRIFLKPEILYLT